MIIVTGHAIAREGADEAMQKPSNTCFGLAPSRDAFPIKWAATCSSRNDSSSLNAGETWPRCKPIFKSRHRDSLRSPWPSSPMEGRRWRSIKQRRSKLA